MRIIRDILGSIILFFDWVFTPKSIERDASQQEKIDRQTANLALYEYKACPFCVKVRRSFKRNSLKIPTHDVKRSERSRDELLQGGGILKVPCLRIEENNSEVRWMYESNDIIDYLETQISEISPA
jgi:glutaredoxin